MTTEKTNFEEAVRQFQEFLEKEGESRQIAWVWPEDVLATGKRFVYVRVPVREASAAKVAEAYDKAVADGLGVRLSTLCYMPGATCCYVWGSRDDHQKGPQWPFHGFMMSIKRDSGRIPGKPVRNVLRWAWLSWWHRKKQGARDFMFQ